MQASAFEQAKKVVLASLKPQEVLGKPDKSLKGEIDRKFQSICGYLNEERSAYYTTSCCSGRVSVFLSEAGPRKKSGFLCFVAHEIDEIPLNWKIDKFKELIDQQASQYRKSTDKHRNLLLPGELNAENLTAYLRFEPLIIHIRAKTLEDAMNLISACRESGLKEVGITSIKTTGALVSVSGTLRLATPLKLDGKWLTDDDTLQRLLKHCRDLMSQNDEKLVELERKIRSRLQIAHS